MSKSDYLENQLLGWLRGNAFAAAPAAVYLSLHTADPGETGANEHGGTAAYARKPVVLGAGNPATNAAAVDFNQATANYSADITHAGLWDAAAGGNFLGGGALPAPRTIRNGDIPRIGAGAFTWTED